MKYLFLGVVLCMAFISPLKSFSQIQTVTVPSSQDCYATYTSATTATFTNNTQLRISSKNTSTPYCRIFAQFDGIRGVSYIPANAVIVSATLRLQSTSEASTDLTLQTVTSSWSETATGTVNPSTTSTNEVATNLLIIAGGVRTFDVTTLVKNIRNGATIAHYGWMIRKTTETSRSGYNNYSSSPTLVVTYYIPASVSAATVTHATGLNTLNGAISPTIVNGATPTSRIYKWYNASNAEIFTGQNITGLNPGFYGLKVYGTTAGDTLFQGFIVGAQCEEVTVNVPTGSRYMQDAMIYDLNSGGSDYNQVNSGNYSLLAAESNNLSSVWYDRKSLLRFGVWVDPGLTLNQADLTLFGSSHDNTRSNESEFVKVTQAWNEDWVNYSNQPTVSTAISATLAAMATGSGNKTVNLLDFFNNWKQNNAQNYGVLFRLKDYSNTLARQSYNSSNARNATNYPQLVFKVAIPNCDLSLLGTSTVTLNNTTQTANIAVSVTPPSWAVAPYHYRILNHAIPEMTDDYKYLRDSVYDGNLDSTTFFTGTVNSTNFTFTDFGPDAYWIAVFDSKGKRIYNKNQVSAQFPVTYLSQTNLTTTGSEISCASAGGGKGELAMVFDKLFPGNIDFEIREPFPATAFGLAQHDVVFSNSSHLKYGVYISAGKLYTVSNGITAAKYYTVQAGARVRFEIYNDSIDWTLNDTLIQKMAVDDDFYKAVISLANTGKVIARTRKFYSLYRFTETQPAINCTTTSGNYTFKLSNILSGTANKPFSYTITGNNANVVTNLSGSGVTGTAVSVNLSPGMYTITYSGSGISQVPTIVYVGFAVNWDDHPNYTLTLPSTLNGTANTTFLNPALYAKSISSNEATENYNYWSWFEFESYPNSLLYPKANYISLTNGLSDQIPAATGGESYLQIRRVISGTAIKYRVYWYNAASSGTTYYYDFNPSDKLRILTSGLNNQVYINNTPVATLIRPQGALKIRANSKGIKSAVKNARTTFPCEVYNIYAELERNLSGVKYKTHGDRLFFAYDEEYSKTTALNFSVFNSLNNEVVSSGSALLTGGPSGAAIHRHGDNRYVLKTESLPGGSYILQVTNEKDEKFYLRFVK